MGRKQATSTRNLRLREDTAKYLLNLDLDSAKYDPKTRSMVDSGAIADEAAKLVAEEGFQKASGDAAEFEKAQRYAWETQEKGDKNKIHLQANPTSGEYFRKKEKEEAAARKAALKKALADKYGNQEPLRNGAAKVMAVTESERFVEYDETGAVKGAPKTQAKSKYPEDVFLNNHTSVWGSWWSNFQWGYKCCHSTVKNSYCTGDQGKLAFEQSERLRAAEGIEDHTLSNTTTTKALENGHGDKDRLEKSKPQESPKKRTLQEMKDGITEKEMDEYRRKRQAAHDPMAAMLAIGNSTPA
jgi:pre-mRNA-processing factor SLU7